jgi:hypothetical protein
LLPVLLVVFLCLSPPEYGDDGMAKLLVSVILKCIHLNLFPFDQKKLEEIDELIPGFIQYLN